MRSPIDVTIMILTCAIGALIILIGAMLVVALGSWGGFFWVWLLLFVIYLIARLVVLDC